MYEAVNIRINQNQIPVLIRTAQFSGLFVMTVYPANFQLSSGYCAISILRTIQRNAVIVVRCGSVWYWIPHQIVHNPDINTVNQRSQQAKEEAKLWTPSYSFLYMLLT